MVLVYRVLCSVVLCCVVLYCVVLCCTVMCGIEGYSTACYSVGRGLKCVVLRCAIWLYIVS